MKNQIIRNIYRLLICLIFSACSLQQAQTSPDTATETISPTPSSTSEAADFPLSEPGTFGVGKREYTLVDNSRDGRVIQLVIWYPALKQNDANGNPITINAAPDLSVAPYPLVLTGTNTGTYLIKSHLASYGFVMAIVKYPDSIALNWGFEMIDHPRDILFALDQIATNPPEELEGIIDTDNVGVTGYSSDGSYTLTVSGAQMDPAYYFSQCEQATDPVLLEWFCGPAKDWDSFAAHAGTETTNTDDGLWQPITDDRIRAVMPMAPNGAWLYGNRGLAPVDLPVFIINATMDEYVPYEIEAVYIYEHLQTPEKYLVSFIGKNHMMVENRISAGRIKHFVLAFFGYYLQGQEAYAEYLSEDFVSQFDDLYWGVYTKE